MSKSEFLWVEKYRPQTIDECVLTKDLKDTFNGIVKSGELHNMLLSGTAGTGKTTVAKALCNELGLDWMLINGSEESGIDVLRNKIKQFASTVSLTGGIKVIILDEADYLNAQSTQPALRGFIEEFSNNCRFILTCNFKNRLIEPLHSRCAVVEFNTNKKQLASLASQFMGRLKSILDKEGVTYNEKVIAELIIRHAPDWRRVIGECQRYGSSGEIPAAILIGNSDESVAEVITHLKSKDFKSMRAWVANNAALDTSAIFRKIYDVLSDHADASGIPSAVLILADYQFKASFVADKELNLVAAMTELMANVTWKK
jgi:DNA polymerase III delta prime subunit